LGMVCGLVGVGLVGCAMAEPYNPDRLASGEIAGVGAICSNVMGLKPFESQYAGCVDSLSGSVSYSDRGRALWQARATCLAEGQRADTPGLAECELTRSGERRGSGEVDASASGPARSYFYTSPRDVHRREEAACARLGLEPTDAAFAGCVGNLQSTLFEADNPAQ
jgi:hypothetical protein